MSSTVDTVARPSDPTDPKPGEPGPGDREPGPESPGPHIRRRIDDRWLMAGLVPLFGLGIPHATGLFATLDPSDPAWWWGHPWFVGGAAAIYLANRTLLF